MFDIFQEPFMQTALLGGLIIGSLCAYLGVFVILKKIIFVGIALSEAAALGVAAGLLIGLNHTLAALLATFLAVVLLGIPFQEKRISRECVIGFTYALSAALAAILIAVNPLAESQGINLLTGNLLYISWPDVLFLGGIALIIAVIHLFNFKEFLFVAFDRETAVTTGIRANRSDFLLYLTIGTALSVAMKLCGAIYVFASLVIPAMSGILIARDIKSIFLVSVSMAGLCVLTGLFLSYHFDLPSAPSVVVLYAVGFAVLSGAKFLFRQA